MCCCLTRRPAVVAPQTYALDNKTLLAIEVPVMALLEAKRYEGYKKTGEVRGSEYSCVVAWFDSSRCLVNKMVALVLGIRRGSSSSKQHGPVS